jgi:hypothetical protein
MTSPVPEREQTTRARREDNSQSDSAPAPSAPIAKISTETIGRRFWALPTGSGTPWAVAEEADPWVMSEVLRSERPVVLVPGNSDTSFDSSAAANVKGQLQSKLLDRFQEALFNFGTRFVIGLAWIAVAIGSLRIPGEAKVFGEILLLCGVGFTAYTVVRYGYGVIRWHNRKVDAAHAFAGAKAEAHPLATRLAAALALRKKLKSDERGKSPDDELLDANAYRKLIDEGVTTAPELVALGKAIEHQLVQKDSEGKARKIADVARDAGLDLETAIFYRDLAAAASEIGLQEKVKIEP